MTRFISHRFGTIRYADRILVLDGDQLVGRGTQGELIALDGACVERFELHAARYRWQAIK